MGENDQKKTAPVTATRSGKPSADQIRQLYMASNFVEWTPFAKSMNWPALDSRHGLPVADWIAEKRRIIALEQAENIAEMVFDHRSRWHEDVLKTLREYPEANDAVLSLLKVRANYYIEMANDDMQQATIAKQTGEKFRPKFPDVKTGELTALAIAIKTVTDSKHKSLMIHDWSFKVAETFTDPAQFAAPEDKKKQNEWRVQVIGGENLTSAEMQKMLGDFYDRPQMPHKPEEIAPAPEPVDEEPE